MSTYNLIQYQKRLAWSIIAAVFVIAGAFAARAQGQDLRSLAKNAVITTSQPPPDVTAVLGNLPEADTLIYINPHRILSEAAPRVLPEKDFASMRQGLAELKAKAGIDPSTVDYVVLQVRFRKPAADLSFSLPEFLLVAGGDFDGAALLQMARDEAKGKLREEAYNSKTLNLFTIDDLAKQAEKTPILKSLSELAIVLLSGDTIAIGTTAYVKAAVDAAGGRGRISPDLLSSALRDPNALISTAGSPLTAFAKTFALLGTENNPRAPKCDMKLGDFYAGITMDATSFKLRGAMNADNPDTAKIIKSLLSAGLQTAASAIKDSKAQSALSGLVITPTDTEVLIQADVSQQAMADFIREETKPKQDAAVASPPAKKAAPKRPVKRRVRPKS